MPPLRPGSAALRRHRLSRDGQIYLVTFVTRERRTLFLQADAAGSCVAALTDERSWQRSRLLAWVLMPDHWHGLIELGARESLSHLVPGLKSCSSRRVRRALPAIGSVWDSGFHDRAVRGEDDVQDLARYVVLNPVRAGLVRRAREYPYWGAVWCDP
jgi:REP element-mobilizing transposase RayT